jgi:hypothetical protein
MKKPIHRLVFGALLLSCSPLAFAGAVTTTTFNFNPNGTTITDGTQITNQFAGAIFTNAQEAVVGGFDSFDFPAAGRSSTRPAIQSGSPSRGLSTISPDSMPILSVLS